MSETELKEKTEATNNMTTTKEQVLSPHLRDLENESIHIIREVAGQFDKIGLLSVSYTHLTLPTNREV